MLDVLKYLKTELNKFSPRVYHENAKENALFPYVVFNLPSSTIPENDSEVVVLEIDIWDYSRDGYDATVGVEVLTNRVSEFFKYNRTLNEDYLMIFTKLNEFSLKDPDPNIKRKQLRYSIKYYKT